MAYRLGVFVIRSTGENWVSSMLDVIRIEKITHLIFERLPNEKYIKRIFRRSELDRLISKCKNLDIYILSNESILERKKKFFQINTSGFKTSIWNYIKSAPITLSAVAKLRIHIPYYSCITVYLFLNRTDPFIGFAECRSI